MKKIVLTGGGTAGHVTPNIALIPHLLNKNYDIYYIGSKNGIEKELISDKNIPYFEISTGKLRRYIDVKNLTDAFRVVKGLGDSLRILSEIKPDIVFSKGGFVAVPVVIAAKLRRIPVVCHESDITPGLANKIAAPFAKKICTSFPETVKYVPNNKGVLTGTPIRDELFKGNRKRGLDFLKFKGDKPVILIMGGSLGSVKINNAVREILGEICKRFDIVHLCGKNNISGEFENYEGYRQYEYISEELRDIFAAIDIVCARAGSNSIFEYLALHKPMLLIPLSKNASRGDQILNANSFKKQGFAEVLEEEELNSATLIKALDNLYENRNRYISEMEKADIKNGVDNIINIIEKYYVPSP